MKNYAKTDSNNITIIFFNNSATSVSLWVCGAARAPPFIVTVRRKPPKFGRLILNEGRADSIEIAPRRFCIGYPLRSGTLDLVSPYGGDFGDVVHPAKTPAPRERSLCGERGKNGLTFLL